MLALLLRSFVPAAVPTLRSCSCALPLQGIERDTGYYDSQMCFDEAEAADEAAERALLGGGACAARGLPLQPSLAAAAPPPAPAAALAAGDSDADEAGQTQLVDTLVLEATAACAGAGGTPAGAAEQRGSQPGSLGLADAQRNTTCACLPARCSFVVPFLRS